VGTALSADGMRPQALIEVNCAGIEGATSAVVTPGKVVVRVVEDRRAG